MKENFYLLQSDEFDKMDSSLLEIKRKEFEKNFQFFDPLNLRADVKIPQLHNPDHVSS